MTGILIAIVVVVLLARLPKMLNGQRAIAPRFEPMPLADQRTGMAGRFAAEDNDEDERGAPATAAASPTRSTGRPRYLLDGRRSPGADDRTQAMMDLISGPGPGLCTPRPRRTP